LSSSSSASFFKFIALFFSHLDTTITPASPPRPLLPRGHQHQWRRTN
jgi:hypothetical protein